MDINARILELSAECVDLDARAIAARMRNLVEDLLVHFRDECRTVHCECGEVIADYVRHEIWKGAANT